MTRISIVGGGPAATLHGEAVRATPGAELVGVGGRPGTAGDLATALAVDDLPLHALCESADAIVVAVPPAEVEEIVATAEGMVRAILIESPLATTVLGATRSGGRTPVMTAANLLHAPEVRRGLRAVAEMSTPHHLVLTAGCPKPTWGAHGTLAFGGGAILDPGARLLPVLLAAAGSPVISVSAEAAHRGGIDDRTRLSLGFADGRTARAEMSWGDPAPRARLEVADPTGVVVIDLLPRPSVERDGTPLSAAADDPLVALGFVDQIRRLAAVARGEAAPWADRSVGVGALTIAASAAASAATGGVEVACADVDVAASPAEILGASGQ